MLMTKKICKIAINQQWWNDIVEFKFIRNVSKNQRIKIKNALESERKKSNLIMWKLIWSDLFDLISDQMCLLLAKIKNVNINISFLFISFFFHTFIFSFFLIISSNFFFFFDIWLLIFSFSSVDLIRSDCFCFILLYFNKLLNFNHEEEINSQSYFKKNKKEVHDVFS